MGLIFKYKGDLGNEFELITDGLPGFNVFHVTEVRGVDPSEIALGVNIDAQEATRVQITDIAVSGGFQLEEFDDSTFIQTIANPPRVTSFTPAQEAVDVAIDDDIVLSFNVNIAKATATGPQIKLIDVTSNTVVEVFEFDSAQTVVATNQLTISPTADLELNNDYAILIDKGYITNVGATAYHGGIYDVDYYNFKTVEA